MTKRHESQSKQFTTIRQKQGLGRTSTSLIRYEKLDFLGLTGTEAQIDAVTQDFGIFYKLNEPEANGYYSVDHTATVQILDRQGNLIMTWPYGQTPPDLLEDLKVLVRK